MKRPTGGYIALVLGVLIALSASGQNIWTELPAGQRAPLVNLPSLSPLINQAMPAVVTVYTKKMVKNFFFLLQPDYFTEGVGSGMIVSRDGYILTNHHVVAGSQEIIVMVGKDEKKDYPARLVGADKETDIALIKIEGADLPVLPLGDSDSLSVGDWVVAIGSPFNLAHTVTLGVVSAKGRQGLMGRYDDFIQTDAAINSGNSGGPLINLAGEVVGINSMIKSPSGGNAGVGFSIPINLAKMLIPQLASTGQVNRGWLGVSIEPVTPEKAAEVGLDRPRGGYVKSVVVSSPADKAGIEAGDVILSFEGKEINSVNDLMLLVMNLGGGKKAKMELWRDQQKIGVEVFIEKDPGPEALSRLQSRGADTGPAADDQVLGVVVRDITNQDRETLGLGASGGVIVVQVFDNSPAASVGIMPGDVIYRVQGKDIANMADYEAAMERLIKPGALIRINVKRGAADIMSVVRLPR